MELKFCFASAFYLFIGGKKILLIHGEFIAHSWGMSKSSLSLLFVTCFFLLIPVLKSMTAYDVTILYLCGRYVVQCSL